MNANPEDSRETPPDKNGAADNSLKKTADKSAPDYSWAAKRRPRNLLLLAALVGLIVLIYAVTIARQGGL
ncbi:MAG: hypothetical protein MPJ52_00460 [Alphaproteobacteria bacterium]|nr:hypothetical protein [Alphaproteobacteria bacterium]